MDDPGRAHEGRPGARGALAPEALALPRGLPRFTGGDFVFTTTGGAKPVNGFAKAKARIDKRSRVARWVIHDLTAPDADAPFSVASARSRSRTRHCARQARTAQGL
jgi:hypothetical protein